MKATLLTLHPCSEQVDNEIARRTDGAECKVMLSCVCGLDVAFVLGSWNIVVRMHQITAMQILSHIQEAYHFYKSNISVKTILSTLASFSCTFLQLFRQQSLSSLSFRGTQLSAFLGK